MNWWDDVDWQDPINRDCPLNAGIVGWWMGAPGLFGGNRLWDLTNRNHGTLTNMDPATDWVTSQYGPVLDFDGTNDYVAIPDAASLKPSRITISGSYKTSYSVGTQVLVGKYVNSGSFPGYAVRLTSGGIFGLWVGGSAWTEGTGYATNDGKWHTFSASYDGTTARVYVDGLLRGAQAQSGNLSGAVEMLFGQIANLLYFSGLMGGISIRNAAVVSEAEATFISDQFRRGFPDMLNHYRRRAIFLPPADTGNRRRRLLICGAA